ncbi:uncharacterized protein B0J16DRAFT_418652 [Fusarium flagelliforme]|uniref:uncharacterized protein n=1 Tax=Fusarium flagelliforme TaxID=2675880 RepID=UPI001E8CFBEF|nr:uncharacterized protein B0J16DRAFT_418652 [Fusarium flagelliforme]KAH7173346.1 hypothetical protein B0J16DRAFT_418652 [Fusarium flagelliforme]
MKFFTALTIASVIAPAVAVPALPAVKADGTCINPPKRVEWRELSAANQKGYIDAVLCLKTKPSRIGLKESTLYDDFPYVHFKLNDWIHGASPFLPWHRYFGVVYEQALRECGYKGPGTYWDWTKDAAKGLLSSPVMSSKNFGGDGTWDTTEETTSGGTRKCVPDGRFSKLRPYYLEDTPKVLESGGHCFFRSMPEVSEPEAYQMMVPTISKKNIDELVNNSKNWTYFATTTEGGPHGSIHASLGGEMNPTTSPNEPLFFLHHAQIDRIWWMWQQKKAGRDAEYNGKGMQYPSRERKDVKLDDVLNMWGLAKDLKIKDVMNPSKGPLCYRY